MRETPSVIVPDLQAALLRRSQPHAASFFVAPENMTPAVRGQPEQRFERNMPVEAVIIAAQFLGQQPGGLADALNGDSTTPLYHI